MKDSLFIRGEKVPMTKEEVRAVTLSKLEIYLGKKFLDVGAGTGSIGIEACILNSKLKVFGIENTERACKIIKQNIDKFKIDNYVLIEEKAPTEIEEKFDRIFIGGSGGNLDSILNWSIDLLEEKGIIVANFIVFESAMKTYEAFKKKLSDVELIQVAINRASAMGRYEYLKPLNPVFIIKGEKID